MFEINVYTTNVIMYIYKYIYKNIIIMIYNNLMSFILQSKMLFLF